MKYRLTMNRMAQIDAEEAVAFQRDVKRNTQAAKRFLATLNSALQNILENPLWFGVIDDDDVRASVMHPLPYTIYFRVKGDHILVHAVFHDSQDPSELEKR